MNAMSDFSGITLLRRVLALAALAVMAGMTPGCASPSHSTPSASAPAQEREVRKARGAYWYAQPGVASVSCGDFYVLWDTCNAVTRGAGFTIDRTDFREGLLTTNPLVSKQPFEMWREDVVDGQQLAQSTFGTVRRTVQFRITRNPNGAYNCVPKVLVERESRAERRITSVTEALDVFSINRPLSDRSTDEGTPIIIEFWYAIGRDNSLESNLAAGIRQQLKSKSCND